VRDTSDALYRLEFAAEHLRKLAELLRRQASVGDAWIEMLSAK